MTKTTLTATLKSLGRFINTYRNTIGATLEPGARKPIQRIAIAHPDPATTKRTRIALLQPALRF